MRGTPIGPRVSAYARLGELEGIDVFLNYLTVAMRNLGRHKVYSTINVLGLAVGMACAVPVILFVQDELGIRILQAKKLPVS